jgi:replication-associated recombination protein RarA
MTKCEIKYHPDCIHDVVFNDADNEQRLKMIFRGFRTRNLFLSGTNGVGKTLIADLIVKYLAQSSPLLHLDNSIETLMSKADLFNYLQNALQCARITGANKNDRLIVVFNELDKYPKSLDKLWAVMDRMVDDLLVIITTNSPMKFENAIRSRCAKFNFTRITPSDFLERAQYILTQENIRLSNSTVLYYLTSRTSSISDVRDYLGVLDELIFLNQNNMPMPNVPLNSTERPTLTLAK